MSGNHLASFENKLNLIRARVTGVTSGMYNAVFLTGRGGIGKSYTVEETLHKAGTPYKLHKGGKLTGAGLFDELEGNSEGLNVIDDVNNVFTDSIAKGILLGATETKKKRHLSYRTKKEDRHFIFTGQIIAISNISLTDSTDPVIEALMTRMQFVNHEPSEEEVAAFMLQLAQHKSFEHLEREQRVEVASFLIEETAKSHCKLHLRGLDLSYGDYIQWENGESFGIHWHDLIRSRLKVPLTAPATRDDRLTQDRQAVRKALDKHGDNIRAAIIESGLSKQAFYRRRAELVA